MASKRYMVVPRTPQAQEQGVDTGRGHRKFAGSKFWVNDPAIAREIDQSVGLKGSGQVWVHEDPGFEFHLKHDGSNGHDRAIHFYTFQGVDTTGIKSNPEKDEYEWITVGPGRQIRVRKGEQHG